MNKKILTIEAVALLLVLGFGAYYYYFYKQQLKLIPPAPPADFQETLEWSLGDELP